MINTTRTNELLPSAFGCEAGILPLLEPELSQHRADVLAGREMPVPAVQLGGWKIVWDMPGGSKMVTLRVTQEARYGRVGVDVWVLVPAARGLTERVWRDEYEVYLATRDEAEFGRPWCLQHRANRYAENWDRLHRTDPERYAEALASGRLPHSG
jgi:hypothetical protein